MDAYGLHETRFIQTTVATSAANADEVWIGPCPVGKIRTILSGLYYPSVNETQVCTWMVLSHGQYFPITVPVSVSLNPTLLPPITEGLEVKIYGGEYIGCRRSSHTAASTMFIAIRFIETDMPYYSYEEPQRKVVKQYLRHVSSFRSVGGVAGGGPLPGGGHSGGGEGGGGGEPQPY